MATLGGKSIKEFVGTVISNKMQNTVVVQVSSVRSHPLYRKRYTTTKKYYAHNPDNVAKLGDVVSIRETRPLSKLKRRIVISVLSKAIE